MKIEHERIVEIIQEEVSNILSEMTSETLTDEDPKSQEVLQAMLDERNYLLKEYGTEWRILGYFEPEKDPQMTEEEFEEFSRDRDEFFSRNSGNSRGKYELFLKYARHRGMYDEETGTSWPANPDGLPAEYVSNFYFRGSNVSPPRPPRSRDTSISTIRDAFDKYTKLNSQFKQVRGGDESDRAYGRTRINTIYIPTGQVVRTWASPERSLGT